MLQLKHELAFSSATGPGWGLTYDGQHLICSDGSDKIVFFKVPTLESVHTEEVRDVYCYTSRISIMHDLTSCVDRLGAEDIGPHSREKGS